MNLNEHLAVLPVVIPLFSAPILVFLQVKHLAWAASLATSVMVFITAIAIALGLLNGAEFHYLLGSWPAPYGIELRIDALSALVLLVVTGASTAALVAAHHSIDQQIETQRQPLFYAAWMLALAGLSGIVVTADAFNIFVFMEISSLASYVLIAGGPNRQALPAVFKYLIFGTIGASFYLIGVGLIYMMTGTLNLADMALRIGDVADQSPVLVAAGFITIGLALKAAVFPLHVWLPNAYTHAPHAVTVFLAACATKVALYVLLRFDFLVFQSNLGGHGLQFTYFLMPLAILAIVIGSAVAIYEKNLKRLFAWSSVAQIGYIVLGASLITQAGLTAGIVHIFNHAIAKGSLFLAIACLALRYKDLGLNALAGSAKAMPWTFGALVIASLSLIGIPGTAGFISKWYLITALIDMGAGGIGLIAVVIVGSLMAVVYIWRIVEHVYFKPALASNDSNISISEAPVLILAITYAAALANIYFGLNPELPFSLASSAASTLMEHVR